MSSIDKVFHEEFCALHFLMHELSKKPGKIFREAIFLMHELLLLKQNMSQGITSHSDKIFHKVFCDVMNIYVKERERQNDLPQRAAEALYPISLQTSRQAVFPKRHFKQDHLFLFPVAAHVSPKRISKRRRISPQTASRCDIPLLQPSSIL